MSSVNKTGVDYTYCSICNKKVKVIGETKVKVYYASIVTDKPLLELECGHFKEVR